VELIVGVLVVLGLLAVVTRFITRDASGQIRLPRVVDDSIGMWALRRITGRSLGERPLDDGVPDGVASDANVSDATQAGLGAIAAAGSATGAADPVSGPARSAPIASRRASSTIGMSPTPVHDLRRRQLAEARRTGRPTAIVPVFVRAGRRRNQARTKGILGWVPRLAAMGAVAVVLALAIIVFGIVVLPRGPQGEVLDSTGRPNLSPHSQIAAAASSSASGAAASPSVELPTPSKGTVARNLMLPKATITSLTKSAINGSTRLRLTLNWTLTDTGSGLRSQLLQRRTDGGAWVAVTLPLPSTRTAAFTMSRGHTYAFRVRGTDRSGNVGLFVYRSIRI